MKISKFYLNELINYYQSKSCETVYKMNDHMDIMIGFIYESNLSNYTNKHRYLKELLLIKRYEDGKRSVFKVRIRDKDETRG